MVAAGVDPLPHTGVQRWHLPGRVIYKALTRKRSVSRIHDVHGDPQGCERRDTEVTGDDNEQVDEKIRDLKLEALLDVGVVGEATDIRHRI